MIEFYQDEQAQWRFRVKGRNGEIVAGSEPYASKANAVRGLDDLRHILNSSATTRVVGVKQAPGE